jgi:hypothetical protein
LYPARARLRNFRAAALNVGYRHSVVDDSKKDAITPALLDILLRQDEFRYPEPLLYPYQRGLPARLCPFGPKVGATTT